MSKILLKKVDQFYSLYSIAACYYNFYCTFLAIYFCTGNIYPFTENQFPQTWLRNPVLGKISSEQKATFLMEPFNVLKDKASFEKWASFEKQVLSLAL